MTNDQLQSRRDLVFGRGAELFYDEPIELVRGEGAYLYDRDGRRYVDLYNNVPCVGHGNVAVAEAMAAQQRTLNVHNRYLHGAILDFAERLCATHHDGIESVVFSCTGTEANEVALRMAREVTGARGIVCTDAAYHGSSGLVDTLTYVGQNQSPTHMVRGFPFPDLYRPLTAGLTEEALTGVYLNRVDDAINALRKAGHGFAALIICPILANEGLPRVPAGFMSRLSALVRDAGGLLIADEVQSGYCRTGTWWAYTQEHIEPDIVVSGKPMGNGLPLAATAACRDYVETFRRATGYFNTFASTPLQAAAGMAVMDEIERKSLADNAAVVGQWLSRELAAISEGHPYVGDVRGRGLFASLEMVTDRATKTPAPDAARWIANAMKDAGFLLSNAGTSGHVVKIRPPLVFSQQDAEATVSAMQQTLQKLRDA
ncbi:MAG: aminotransferase class III-fold pyridoxal phosphate-dependent enzyme [Halieaceae bacterium]|jgi:4-aminobutyrate aminotransferase-like enzyme|nr:aminotransferase class III-fold pyridoxal phosphate-dependent enzyme [Halieaceae bacterium]